MGGKRAFTRRKIGLELAVLCLVGSSIAWGRGKDTTPYGAGLIVNVPFPENEVALVVQDVVQNGIIRGTKEYNKDEYVAGAEAQSSARGFRGVAEEGKVFYKVRMHAVDPRNFKDGGDVGTLAVRYIVQPQGDKNSVLHIDAIFVEDFRHTVHLSNGLVESAEYKDIRDHLDAAAVMKTQAAELERERKERPEQKAASAQIAAAQIDNPQISPPAPVAIPEDRDNGSKQQSSVTPQAPPPAQSLEDHVKNLRRQLERLVKAPGAPLKSAPFHTASTLQSLPSGTEVLVVITTPYWVGVETHEGQHGWMLRDDLELLP